MTRAGAAALAVMAAALAWSGWRPADRFTWVLETAPVMLALPGLALTARRFPLTPLSYSLAALHAIVLCVGGHWTYAEVPAGFWVRDALGLERNHYDRLGHFVQGFVPAIIAREILVRRSPLTGGWWLPFGIGSFCLAFSALYELIEWWTALATGEAATAFLGTQGDPWDTQWDMFLAMVGAIAALTALSGWHDAQMRRGQGDGGRGP
ncbi:MAG: DUF2238 domain-containing protein [Gemmatimonadales bacterium]|nr:DUF2238 domain-containing protein [Gemmatimonadales bacterium]